MLRLGHGVLVQVCMRGLCHALGGFRSRGYVISTKHRVVWVYTRVLSLTRSLDRALNPQTSSIVLNLRQGSGANFYITIGVCRLDTIPQKWLDIIQNLVKRFIGIRHIQDLHHSPKYC